jgi:hypothetical protein
MMTVHAAKGLEFPHVFLCGMSESVFPSKKTATAEGMEEERRLAFVAVTRARQSLHLSDAEGRNPDGSFRVPSRFIMNIEKGLLQYTAELPDSLVREAEWRIRGSEASLAEAGTTPRFAVGDRVMHAIMGAGQVVGIDEGQFFDAELPAVCNTLADQGKRVIVAGLDQDYLGKPFEPMPQLLAIAEYITKTLAICVVCGAPANHTQRLVASQERVLVGASGAYEARCRGCFDPRLAGPVK